jgi:hypothetical protein
MFFLTVFVVIGGLSGQAMPVQSPTTYATDDLCRKAGTANALAHIMPHEGDGGGSVRGFICLSK